MPNDNLLQNFGPPTPGPFSQYLDPTNAYQYQSNQQRPSGYMGGIGKTALVADKFLEGFSRGRLANYAKQEKTATENQRALLSYADEVMKSGDLTPEGQRFVSQAYSKAIAPEVAKAADEAAKQHKDNGIIGHIFGAVGTAAKALAGPLPGKTKNINPSDVIGQIEIQLQNNPQYTIKGSREAAVSSMSAIADKYKKDPNATVESVLNDPEWGKAFNKVQEYAGAQQAGEIQKSMLGGLFGAYTPEQYQKQGAAAEAAQPAPQQTAAGPAPPMALQPNGPQTGSFASSPLLPGAPAPPAKPVNAAQQPYAAIPANRWAEILSDKTIGYVPKEEQYINKTTGEATQVFQIRGRDGRLNGVYNASTQQRINPDEYEPRSTYNRYQHTEIDDPTDQDPYHKRAVAWDAVLGRYVDPITLKPIEDATVTKPKPTGRTSKEKIPNRTDRTKMTMEATIQAMRAAGKDPDNADEFTKFVDMNAKKYPGTDAADLAEEVKHTYKTSKGKQQPQSMADQIRARQQAVGRGAAPAPPTKDQASTKQPDENMMKLLQQIGSELKSAPAQ